MKSPNLLNLFLFLSLVGMASCGGSKELVTVLVESPNGNTELTYTGSAEPQNMVREVRYTPEGDTLTITPLQEGVLHGEIVTYHANGKRKESVVFADGKKEGPFKAYDLEGAVVFEGMLKDGRKNGVWTHWYDETQMKQQCIYVDDVLTGKCTYWFIDGSVKREETYNDGKLIAAQDF